MVPHAFAQGSLDSIRSDLRDRAEQRDRRHDNSPYDDNESTAGSILGALFQGLFAETVLSSRESENADGTPRLSSVFLAYPYAPNSLDRPLQILGRDREANKFKSQNPTTNARILFDIQAGYLFEGVERYAGSIFLDHSDSRLGILGRFVHYNEEGDRASHWRLDGTIRVFQDERVFAYVGLGGQAWFSGDVSAGGVNLLTMIELFPAKPVHGQFLAEIGSLRSQASFHMQGQIGIALGRGEFYFGYEMQSVGSTSLHGPIVGVRLWW
jgi:hypothetical protein